MHTIKTTRAQRAARQTPRVQTAVWGSISPALIESLSAAQLAEVARCLDRHWHRAQAEGAAAAVAEGVIWTARDQRLLDVQPVA